jgi:hypothetical protein
LCEENLLLQVAFRQTRTHVISVTVLQDMISQLEIIPSTEDQINHGLLCSSLDSEIRFSENTHRPDPFGVCCLGKLQDFLSSDVDIARDDCEDAAALLID